MAGIEFRLDIPDEPLEGDLYIARQWSDRLGHDFVERVYDSLRYAGDASQPVYNASGRNYYIPLPEPIGPYNALQVAGGGNSDLGITTNSGVQDSIVSRHDTDRLITPPREDPGLFTSYTMYHENGEQVERTNVNPIGSYSARSAKRKIEQTEAAFSLLPAQQAGVISPKYIGRFEYGIADQFGEPQTAILMLVPSYGLRLDSKLLLPLQAIEAGVELPSDKTVGEELEPYHKAIIRPRLFSVGWGIGAMHRMGLVHHQLTPGNTDALEAIGNTLVPYITDWDTMTTPAEADLPRSKSIDMLVAVQAACTGLKRLARMEAIGTETAAELVMDTVARMLQGYFEGRGGLYTKAVDMRDGVNVAVGNCEVESGLDIVESWVS